MPDPNDAGAPDGGEAGRWVDLAPVRQGPRKKRGCHPRKRDRDDRRVRRKTPRSEPMSRRTTPASNTWRDLAPSPWPPITRTPSPTMGVSIFSAFSAQVFGTTRAASCTNPAKTHGTNFPTCPKAVRAGRACSASWTTKSTWSAAFVRLSPSLTSTGTIPRMTNGNLFRLCPQHGPRHGRRDRAAVLRRRRSRRRFDGPHRQLDVYDVDDGMWRLGAPMPTSRAGGAGAVLGGVLYVFGGKATPPIR